MGIDFTAFNAALEKVIMPTIKPEVYSRAPMWQIFGGWAADVKDSNGNFGVALRANVGVEKFENDKIYIPIRTSYHSGIVGIALSEKYQYGQPTIQTTYASLKTPLVGSFTIPKQLVNTTNRGAVVKPLMFYSDSLSRDLASDANRQIYGDATAAIASTQSAGSGTQTVLLTPSTNGDIDYSRYFPVGTHIRIASATGGNDGAATDTTVTAVTGDNSITVADSMSFSASANIYKTTGSHTVSTELDGLKLMVNSSGSYQALDAATENTWKSHVDAVNGSLDHTAIEARMHKSFFKANQHGKVDWIVMNSSLYQTYGNSQTGQKRADVKEVLSGEWIGLDYMGGNAKVLLDYDCPDDRIYFLSTEDLVFAQMQDLEFEKGTDGNLLKIAQQLDYEVTASWMGNVGTIARNSQSVMTGITAGF
jgi:hypothetical protein